MNLLYFALLTVAELHLHTQVHQANANKLTYAINVIKLDKAVVLLQAPHVGSVRHSIYLDQCKWKGNL
jgi:hypothetical protein